MTGGKIGNGAVRIDIISILPELFSPFLQYGVCGRAVAGGKATINFWNPRDYAAPPRRAVDDRPYGGGSGMVLLAAPVLAAARAARAANPAALPVYLAPRGELLTDNLARELARAPGLALLCGRYRGIDERAAQQFGGREVSVGDYVLSGGEPAAIVLIDAVLRHLPGVLGNAESADEEAFAGGLLDAPCYTRPPVFEGMPVPAELLSGNHAATQAWRRQQAQKITARARPRLLSENKEKD